MTASHFIPALCLAAFSAQQSPWAPKPVDVSFAAGRLARARGGGEVALRIALATEVEVILSGPQKATPVKVPLDPPDRLLQHLAHLPGLEMSEV